MALESFGFGEKFKQMVQVIFRDPLATVSNNGYCGDTVTPQEFLYFF